MSDEKPATVYEALGAVMRDLPAVAKERRNPEQGYQFRGIDDLYDAIQPVMARHGLLMVPEVRTHRVDMRETRRGNPYEYVFVEVAYHLFGPDGSALPTPVVTWGEGSDTSDKASNKAMAGAHKYALLQLFLVPTGLVADGEAEAVEMGRRPSEPKVDPDAAALFEQVRSLPQWAKDQLAGGAWPDGLARTPAGGAWDDPAVRDRIREVLGSLTAPAGQDAAKPDPPDVDGPPGDEMLAEIRARLGELPGPEQESVIEAAKARGYAPHAPPSRAEAVRVLHNVATIAHRLAADDADQDGDTDG